MIIGPDEDTHIHASNNSTDILDITLMINITNQIGIKYQIGYKATKNEDNKLVEVQKLNKKQKA